MMDALPGDTFQPGDLLNNTYRVEGILGRGGTSEVYRARSEISGRVVAVKALRAEFSRNDDYLALMTREEDIREIRNDAIVRYYDTQRTDDGHVYLVMDYVDGPGLDQRLKQGGMSAEDLMVVARRVAEGLVAAHGRNIVHRDLSPDNIILRNGNPQDAVIIDFGIAKDTNPGAATIVGNDFAGKYAYAAPEQLGGQTDARSDLYALGALLLATFRGKQPDVGANPMEVVTRKGLPLDSSGVPEPLKSLIERLTTPKREDRLQTARDVLAYLQTANLPEAEERTVIVPRASRPTTVPPPPPAQPSTQPRATPAPARTAAAPLTAEPAPRRGKGGLIAVALVALLAAVGGGAWVSGALNGVLGPSLPVVSPFALTLSGGAGGIGQAAGHVPDQVLHKQISEALAASGNPAQLDLAQGALAPGWTAAVQALLAALAEAPEWRLALVDNRATVTGLAADRAQRDRLLAALKAVAGPLTLDSDIGLGPRLLPVADLTPVLTRFADCGELRLIDPPATGYPMGARIAIAGNVSAIGNRVGLADAVSAIAGDRAVDVVGEVFNPALCKVDLALPKAPPGGIQIDFGFGDRPEANTDGRYFVGENPVIDVILPATMTDGFIFVSALDVSGKVFHMLPNLLDERNSVAELRKGQAGPFKLRVAWSMEEAKDGDRLAFQVNDEGLGKSRILVIHAKEQIFGGIRPTTESAEAYAEALRMRSGPVDALDSRIMTLLAKP